MLQMHNAAVIIACDEEAFGKITVETYKYVIDVEEKERFNNGKIFWNRWLSWRGK